MVLCFFIWMAFIVDKKERWQGVDNKNERRLECFSGREWEIG